MMMVALSMGCGSGGSETGGSANGMAESAGPDTYFSGLEKVGAEGTIIVRLIQSDPIPKDVGYYDWTLEILSVDGKTLEGVQVSAEPTMPAHDHGTMPRYTNGTTDQTGRAMLKAMYLYMPGIWNIDVRIKKEDGTTDGVQFEFDLKPPTQT